MSAPRTTQLNIVNPKNSKRHLVKFVVVNGEYTPLLGAKTAQEMELLTVQHDNILNITEKTETKECRITTSYPTNLEQVMSSYGDGGWGRMEGDADLEINENAQPRVMPPRRVPIAIN